jgi:hypothetical protein
MHMLVLLVLMLMASACWALPTVAAVVVVSLLFACLWSILVPPGALTAALDERFGA